MGKQGSPRRARSILQNTNSVFRTKDYHIRSSLDSFGATADPSIGRRILGGENYWDSKAVLLHGLKDESGKLNPCKGVYVGKKHTWFRRNVKPIAFMMLMAFMLSLMAFLFLLDSVMTSLFTSTNLQGSSTLINSNGSSEDGVAYTLEERPPVQMYGRLLNLASGSLAEKEFKQHSLNFWEEPYHQASKWKPCADKKILIQQPKGSLQATMAI